MKSQGLKYTTACFMTFINQKEPTLTPSIQKDQNFIRKLKQKPVHGSKNTYHYEVGCQL